MTAMHDLLTTFGQAYHKLLTEGAEHAPAVEAAEAAIIARTVETKAPLYAEGDQCPAPTEMNGGDLDQPLLHGMESTAALTSVRPGEGVPSPGARADETKAPPAVEWCAGFRAAVDIAQAHGAEALIARAKECPAPETEGKRRRELSATQRLHNLCDALSEHADESPFTREEWDAVDKQTVRLTNALKGLIEAVRSVEIDKVSWDTSVAQPLQNAYRAIKHEDPVSTVKATAPLNEGASREAPSSGISKQEPLT